MNEGNPGEIDFGCAGVRVIGSGTVVYSVYGVVYCCLVHLLEPRIVNMSFLPPPLLVPRIFAGRKIISLVIMLNFNKICCLLFF